MRAKTILTLGALGAVGTYAYNNMNFNTHKAQDMKDKAAYKAGEVKGMASEKASEMKSTLQDKAQQGMNKASEIKEHIKESSKKQ